MPVSPVLSILILLSFSVQDDAQRARQAQQYFITGKSLQAQRGREAEAILEYQQALRLDSASATLLAMAECYVALRKPALAEEHARAALVRDSSSTRAAELLAEILIANGRYDEALTVYERSAASSGSVERLLTLARLYEPRDPAKAAMIYERCYALAPSMESLERLTRLYRRLRRPDQEADTWKRMHEQAPADHEITMVYEEALIRSGRAETLSGLLRTKHPATSAREYEMQWTTTLMSMSQDTLFSSMYPDTCRSLARTARTMFPRQWPVLGIAAGLALVVGPVELADSLMIQAMQVDPNDDTIATSMVFTALNFDHPERAWTIGARASDRFTRNAHLAFLTGSALVQMDRFGEAIPYFRRTVEIQPSFTDAWIQMASAYDHLDRTDSAEYAYEQVLALDEEHHMAANNLAYSLSQRGADMERARELSWQALQRMPSNPAYLDTYAWILFKLRDLDGARLYIEQAIRLGGGNVTHFDHLGDILEASNDHQGAIAAWRRALALDPNRTDIQQKIDRNP